MSSDFKCRLTSLTIKLVLMFTIFRFILISFILLGVCSFSSNTNSICCLIQANDTIAKTNAKSADVLKKGKALFEKNCIMCHGALGHGDGPAGLFLNPRPFDISSDKVQSQTDSTLFFKITIGKAPMPTFKTLSFESRQLLVNYVRSLAKNKTK